MIFVPVLPLFHQFTLFYKYLSYIYNVHVYPIPALSKADAKNLDSYIWTIYVIIILGLQVEQKSVLAFYFLLRKKTFDWCILKL